MGMTGKVLAAVAKIAAAAAAVDGLGFWAELAGEYTGRPSWQPFALIAVLVVAIVAAGLSTVPVDDAAAAPSPRNR